MVNKFNSLAAEDELFRSVTVVKVLIPLYKNTPPVKVLHSKPPLIYVIEVKLHKLIHCFLRVPLPPSRRPSPWRRWPAWCRQETAWRSGTRLPWLRCSSLTPTAAATPSLRPAGAPTVSWLISCWSIHRWCLFVYHTLRGVLCCYFIYESPESKVLFSVYCHIIKKNLANSKKLELMIKTININSEHIGLFKALFTQLEVGTYPWPPSSDQYLVSASSSGDKLVVSSLKASPVPVVELGDGVRAVCSLYYNNQIIS